MAREKEEIRKKEQAIDAQTTTLSVVTNYHNNR